MNNPAANLSELERLAKSTGWQLIQDTLAAEMAKSLLPPAIAGSLDQIAIATVSRSATYTALDWARNKMLGEMIAREKKAANE